MTGVACDGPPPPRPGPAGEALSVGLELQVALALGQVGLSWPTLSIPPHHLSRLAGGGDALPTHQHQRGPSITGSWQEVSVAISGAVWEG